MTRRNAYMSTPMSASPNLCRKTVTKENAYEVWSNDTGWTWYVLKKWQGPAKEDGEFARWFCLVTSPMVPEGEMGDVYVREIKRFARRIK